MCEYFGYEVVKLERVRIMNITLKGIPTGEWRLLNDAELQHILKAIANSTSEQKPAAKKSVSPSNTPASKNRKSSADYRKPAKPAKPASEPRIGKSRDTRSAAAAPSHRKTSQNRNSRPTTGTRGGKR